MSDADRLERLELKLMDLENSLQELNEVVIAQYRDIERLRAVQQTLLQRLEQQGEQGGKEPKLEDEVPPHY